MSIQYMLTHLTAVTGSSIKRVHCPAERWERIPGAVTDRKGHPRWSHRVWGCCGMRRDSQASQVRPWENSHFPLNTATWGVIWCLFVFFTHRFCVSEVGGLCMAAAGELRSPVSCSCEPDDSMEPYTTERLSRLPGGYKPLTDPFTALSIDFNNVQVKWHRRTNANKIPFLSLSILTRYLCKTFVVFSSVVTCRSWRGWAPGRSRGYGYPSLRRGSWMLWLCGSSSTWMRTTVCPQDPRRTPAGSKPSTLSTAPRVRLSRHWWAY